MEKRGGTHARQKECIRREEGQKSRARTRGGRQSVWLEFGTGGCWSRIQGLEVAGARWEEAGIKQHIQLCEEHPTFLESHVGL